MDLCHNQAPVRCVYEHVCCETGMNYHPHREFVVWGACCDCWGEEGRMAEQLNGSHLGRRGGGLNSLMALTWGGGAEGSTA